MERRGFIKSAVGFSLAGMLLEPSELMFGEVSASWDPPRVINLRSDRVTTIMGELGRLTAGLTNCTIVSGFASPRDSVTWAVNAPREDDYAVGLIFSAPGQMRVELRSERSVLEAQSLPRTWPGRPFYWRQDIPGLLHLKKGVNQITFRLPEAKTGAPPVDCGKYPDAHPSKSFSLWSIELGTPVARKSELEEAERIRGDASWMIEGKYGQFIHWVPECYPFHGDHPRWQWNERAVAILLTNRISLALGVNR